MEINKQFFIRSRFNQYLGIVYLSGIIIHVIRLITRATPSELIPLWFDYWVVLGTFYGSIILGLVIYSNQINFNGTGNKVMSILVLVHLVITVIFHLRTIITQDNSNFDIFPYWYSIIVVIWFTLFGYWIYTSNTRIGNNSI